MSSFLHLDAILFHLIYQLSHRLPLLDAVGIFLTHYGLAALFLIGALFICKKVRDTEEGIFLLAQLFIATTLPYLFTFFLRFLIHRPRPFLIFPYVKPLVSVSGALFGPSFPSGHATLAFAFATACFLFLGRRSGYACAVIAFFIALSRVFAGVHFVSDILAGAAIGILGAFFAKNIFLHPMQSSAPLHPLRKRRCKVL